MAINNVGAPNPQQTRLQAEVQQDDTTNASQGEANSTTTPTNDRPDTPEVSETSRILLENERDPAAGRIQNQEEAQVRLQELQQQIENGPEAGIAAFGGLTPSAANDALSLQGNGRFA